MPVCYADIRRFVRMLISSEITGNYLWRSYLNPATASSTDCAARNLLNINDLTIFRVAKTTTLKMAILLSANALRAAPRVLT